ncbi:MAG: fibronectin type III domain-containing protein [Clostridiales bacterium]|nr:fibronectin type III domain-containing protein [Clostridiales bacterium]
MATVPAAEFTSSTTLAITGVAEDAENVTVTVKASGKNGASLTDEAKSIVDGVVTLDTAATDGVTYRVTISSDNYASNIVNAVYTAADTTALTAAIEQAEALTESDYTAASWAAMQTALETAKTVAASGTTSQTEVDEATSDLTAAVAALEAAAGEEELAELTTTASQASALTESDYTAESWAALEAALENANAVLNNADASQSEVEEALAALTAAISALETAEAKSDTETETGTETETVTAPAATKITSAVNKAKGIKLTWNAVDGATSYQVYRKIGSGSWKKVKTTSSTTWTDTAATKNGTKYQYKVYAVNEGGKSSASATKTIYRLTAKHFTRAKNVKGKKISLKWTRNTKATGYVIEYSTSKSFTSSTTKTVKLKGNKNLTTTLKNLKKGKTYYIRMRAYKTSGSVTSYAGWSKVKTVKVKK